MQGKATTNKIWVTVRVDRGIPAEVRVFSSANKAIKVERSWRRKINLDYGDTDTFKVSIE
jgi:hypothetical protein